MKEFNINSTILLKTTVADIYRWLSSEEALELVNDLNKNINDVSNELLTILKEDPSLIEDMKKQLQSVAESKVATIKMITSMSEEKRKAEAASKAPAYYTPSVNAYLSAIENRKKVMAQSSAFEQQKNDQVTAQKTWNQVTDSTLDDHSFYSDDTTVFEDAGNVSSNIVINGTIYTSALPCIIDTLDMELSDNVKVNIFETNMEPLLNEITDSILNVDSITNISRTFETELTDCIVDTLSKINDEGKLLQLIGSKYRLLDTNLLSSFVCNMENSKYYANAYNKTVYNNNEDKECYQCGVNLIDNTKDVSIQSQIHELTIENIKKECLEDKTNKYVIYVCPYCGHTSILLCDYVNDTTCTLKVASNTDKSVQEIIAYEHDQYFTEGVHLTMCDEYEPKGEPPLPNYIASYNILYKNIMSFMQSYNYPLVKELATSYPHVVSNIIDNVIDTLVDYTYFKVNI